MIGRKQNLDVFVLGEEGLLDDRPTEANPEPLEEEKPSGRDRQADPFLIEIESASAEEPSEPEASAPPKRMQRSWPGGTRRWAAGLALSAGAAAVVGATSLGPAPPEHPPPRTQEADTTPPVFTDAKPSLPRRDSRPRRTRVREPRRLESASSSPVSAAPDPPSPVVASAPPPSAGGRSGGGEGFGFER
jgi:hypothetical protein